MSRPHGILGCLTLLLSLAVAQAAPVNVTVQRHEPCNLFAPDEPVRFQVDLSSKTPGISYELTIQVLNYWGEAVVERQMEVDSSQKLDLQLGELPPGYYALTFVFQEPLAGLEAAMEAIDDPDLVGAAPMGIVDESKQPEQFTHTTSFGVATLTDRSAAEVRDGDYRFGMKLWTIGEIWWLKGVTFDHHDVMRANGKLGLQWTRALIHQTRYMDTQELMTQFPQNVILKIENFPPECYDSANFGPINVYQDAYNKPWNRSSVPLEEPYKKWVKEQVAAIPPEQNVFEIWNEPWQWSKTMPPEAFAKICSWTVDAIREVRPDAIVGPNITGDVHPYDIAVIDAGGLRGMDMVAIHPYTASTPEQKGFRQRLRNYHDLLRAKLGRDLDLYATEFGWSTAPEGDRSVSETEQAQYTVREALMLYAEGVKTLIPHTMGQREQDPTDREHYFGFYRLNQEPKPALLAFAACGRVIDGSTFLGDLWYGPGVGAMLFERDGVRTLALWTENDGARELDLQVHATSLERVDMMGRRQRVNSTDGALSVAISGDVTYLVGVGAELAGQVTTPDQPLNPERWHPRAATHSLARLAAPPTIDGDLADWAIVPTNPYLREPGLGDISASWRFAWDDDYLYACVEVADSRIVNDRPLSSIHMADAVVLNINARPDRQVSNQDLYDYVVTIAPHSAIGAPAMTLKNDLAETITNPDTGHPSGVQWAVKEVPGRSWTVELAIPHHALNVEPLALGDQLAANIVVYDRDHADKDEWAEYHKRVQLVSKKAPLTEHHLFTLAPAPEPRP